MAPLIKQRLENEVSCQQSKTNEEKQTGFTNCIIAIIFIRPWEVRWLTKRVCTQSQQTLTTPTLGMQDEKDNTPHGQDRQRADLEL